MRITPQLSDLRLEHDGVVLAAGYFDGVHRGHQAVLGAALEKARSLRAEAWALTLDPHPMKVLKPEAAPALITSTEHKVRLIEELGLDGCVVMPFTGELAAEEPSAFLRDLHENVPSLRELVMGENWTFGHGGVGNAGLAARLAPGFEWTVTVVKPVMWGGEPISSTRVRRTVAEGRLDDAAEMLGRPFSILGTVVRGRRVGTQLGFPTANLDPHNEVRPPSGVYAVHVLLGRRRYRGAAFLDDMPTAQAGPSGFLLEVHLLDFEDELYGQDIEMAFAGRVRDVRRFASRAELRAQIVRDVQQVRDMLT